MATPTPAQLALSASLFTTSIDAWIPTSFGPKTTDADRDLEFAKRLKDAAAQGENNNLGLGHPDLGVYKPRGPSLANLEKKLGRVDRRAGKRKDDEVGEKSDKAGDESDEEESRGRVGGGKKRGSNVVNDLLGGKKKRKVGEGVAKVAVVEDTVPLLNLAPRASTPDKAVPMTSSPGGAGDFPFAGPVALGRAASAKVSAGDLPGDGTQSAGSDDEPASTSGTPTKSKSAKRREAKKRAKMLRKQAEE